MLSLKTKGDLTMNSFKKTSVMPNKSFKADVQSGLGHSQMIK